MNDNIKEYLGARTVLNACRNELVGSGLEELQAIEAQAIEREEKAWKEIVYDALRAFEEDPQGAAAEEFGYFLHDVLSMAEPYSGICNNPDTNIVQSFEALASDIACDYVRLSNEEDELTATFGDKKHNEAVAKLLNDAHAKAEEEADRMLVCWLQAVEAGCDTMSKPLSNLSALLRKRCGFYT